MNASKHSTEERRALIRAGFTLLEVMVAVAILALGLTSIFSSEVGAMHIASRAKHLNVGTLLARCKLGEIEEQIAREGLPAIDDAERDECCEDAEVEGFTCEWKIERVVLPDVPDGQEEGEENAAQQALAGAGGVADLAANGLDSGLLADLAMSIAFPALKTSIEDQVRRATVTVHWREGKRDSSFDVVRFFVANPPSQTPASTSGTGSGTGTGTSGTGARP
jgi:general secretion pathway protein I